jgi:hypothetical protein
MSDKAQLLWSPIHKFFVRIGTLPYYRLYQFNTKGPIAKIAVIASEQPKSFRLVYAVTLWRARKLTELQFISIAVRKACSSSGLKQLTAAYLQCTVLAAAVIGSFSWTTIEEAYWITHGLWHGSLVLSVLGILLAAQQVAVLNFLGPLPSSKKVREVDVCLGRYLPVLLSHNGSQYVPRRKMVFTWQCPLMFMSYSVCAFLAGLTVLVCTPLIHRNGGWNEGCNVSTTQVSKNLCR